MQKAISDLYQHLKIVLSLGIKMALSKAKLAVKNALARNKGQD
jgi:hypothetical protein